MQAKYLSTCVWRYLQKKKGKIVFLVELDLMEMLDQRMQLDISWKSMINNNLDSNHNVLVQCM